LNEASRLLDLEESGQFSFWDVEELDALLAAEGFRGVKVWPSLGSPPQAVVASAFR
jgi:hypothetical protein